MYLFASALYTAFTVISDVTQLKSVSQPVNEYACSALPCLDGAFGAVADLPYSTCWVLSTFPSSSTNVTVYLLTTALYTAVTVIFDVTQLKSVSHLLNV